MNASRGDIRVGCSAAWAAGWDGCVADGVDEGLGGVGSAVLAGAAGWTELGMLVSAEG